MFGAFSCGIRNQKKKMEIKFYHVLYYVCMQLFLSKFSRIDMGRPKMTTKKDQSEPTVSRKNSGGRKRKTAPVADDEAAAATDDSIDVSSTGKSSNSTATEPVQRKPRKKHRFRPGTVALREIVKEQQKVSYAIPIAPFTRVTREIAQDVQTTDGIRFRASALEALHTGAEEFMIEVMKRTGDCSVHRDAKTISDKDMRFAMFITNPTQTEYKPETSISFNSMKEGREQAETIALNQSIAEDQGA